MIEIQPYLDEYYIRVGVNPGPRPKRLALAVTDRCNSKCKICHIWKKPPIDLPLSTIEGVISSPVLDESGFIILTGGEPFLHPNIGKILELLHGKNYFLTTNGILVKKIINVVRKYQVRELNLSLDGTPETYYRVRGVDAYENVIAVIQQLRGEISIKVNFTLNPWNSREDFIHVKELCEQNNLKLVVDIMSPISYIGQTDYFQNSYQIDDLIADSPFLSYLKTHAQWLAGKVRLPCVGTRDMVSLRADGAVLLCQGKDLVLGNVNLYSLEEIWYSREAHDLRKAHLHCNDCWIWCQRLFDLRFISFLEKRLSRNEIKSVLGDYILDSDTAYL